MQWRRTTTIVILSLNCVPFFVFLITDGIRVEVQYGVRKLAVFTSPSCPCQRMTSMLFGDAKYPNWVPTSAYGDTGERNGFVRSILPKCDEGGVEGVEEMGAVDLGTSDFEHPGSEAVPLPELTRSAATLANMQGVHVPHMPVCTPAEISWFSDTFMRYVVNKEGRQSFLDFDLYSLKWDERVASMESGKTQVVGIFRKTAAHLRAHWKQ